MTRWLTPLSWMIAGALAVLLFMLAFGVIGRSLYMQMARIDPSVFARPSTMAAPLCGVSGASRDAAVPLLTGLRRDIVWQVLAQRWADKSPGARIVTVLAGLPQAEQAAIDRELRRQSAAVGQSLDLANALARCGGRA